MPLPSLFCTLLSCYNTLVCLIWMLLHKQSLESLPILSDVLSWFYKECSTRWARFEHLGSCSFGLGWYCGRLPIIVHESLVVLSKRALLAAVASISPTNVFSM